MPAKQSTKNSNSFSPVLIGLLIGAIIMFFTADYWISYSPTTLSPVYGKDIARLNNPINGYYVFIGSVPACSGCYDNVAVFEGDDLLSVIGDLGIGKEKAGKVLENIFRKGQDHLSFEENINRLTLAVKDKYGNQANGIIIQGKLNRCEVINIK